MMTMDSGEEDRLDTEFDKMLVEMRPHVLQLQHKAERQRCAVWIKKFCEPPAPGLLGRKNRNDYANLLLHMLKKGVLEGPFADKPDPGPISTMPSYMSMYFDDMKGSSDQNRVPDWVAGELGSDMSSLPPMESLDSPTMRFQAAQQRFTAALEEPLIGDYLHRKTYFPKDSSDIAVKGREQRRTQPFDMDWTNGTSYTSLGTTGGNSLFRDDSTLPSAHVKETEMQKKMLEAKFQEDKMRLQQKHDANVQKILDRKNLEIEELKRHYRTKSKEQEDVVNKLERKLNHLQKELSATKEAREQETSQLKQSLEELQSSKHQEFDKKMSDLQSRHDDEKFALQKQHTKSIQELLDDTNTRLTKMEAEYNQQMEATCVFTRELETRVQQLGDEAESLTKVRNQLEREKIEMEGRLDRLHADNMAFQEKNIQLEKDLKRHKEDHENELRSVKNKYEANIDYLKQEHSLAAAKAQDRTADLEQQVSQLKQAVDSSEQQRLAQIREMEQSYQQDKIHLETLHDKKIRNLQQEIDQLEQEHQKKVRKMEGTIREKEDEVSRLLEEQKQLSVQSEQALVDFKAQIEQNSAKMFTEMKAQMEKVEHDLHRSKQLREKQTKDFQRQVEEDRYQHSKQMAEKQMSHDQEKAAMLRDIHVQKEVWISDKEQELEQLKETMRVDMNSLEKHARDKQEQDARTISELNQQVQKLREDLVHANSLRKQQLVELGLLREDEKQKMERDHETTLSKLRSEFEQQKYAAEKRHSCEMEQLIEKTNSKVKEIEKEYSVKADQSNVTIMELQLSLKELKNVMNRRQEEAEHEISSMTSRLESEKRNLKQRHATSVMALQQELEGQKSRCRQLERQIQTQEQDYEEQLTRTRSQYEDRLHGLISASVRQELEDTISSLKQQVAILQQRTSVLQEDLDQRSNCDGYAPGGNFQQQTTNFGDNINTLMSSVKSA